jgi:hypothetical protein
MTHISETSTHELETDESEERRDAARIRSPVVLGGLLGLGLAALFHIALRALGIAMSTRLETEIRLVLVGLVGPLTIHGLIVARPDWLDGESEHQDS